MNKCLHCQKLTINPKFCSRSCSASINNKTPKRQKILRTCTKCDIKFQPESLSKRSTLCNSCENKIVRKSNSIKELIDMLNKQGKNKTYLPSKIRSLNKTWNKHLKNNPCQKCGFNKHHNFCDLAHIKSIRSFSDTATLGEINAESNIYVLCPNCHWEFDNGYVTKNQINNNRE